MSTDSPIYNPKDVNKKEARGLRDKVDLGKSRSWNRIHPN